MVDSTDISAIMVNLEIDSMPALFALLAADGSINRMGTGAIDNTDREMFIGITDSQLFESVRSRITDDLLKWIGRRADPRPAGKTCELSVFFMLADKKECAIQFRYGSESVGPPPEVAQFVIAVVEATTPWWENLKAKPAKPE